MKIKILAKTWKTKNRTRLLDGDSGATLPDSCTIWESALECLQQRRDTRLHEVIHVIEKQLHLGMEERQVHALACGLLQVLRENPKLVRYLTKDSS